jgi:hypothetical protein
MGNPFIIAEDQALKTYLSGITVSDDTNPSRPVKVWFGYPDIEVRDQSFPFITIDLIDILPANNRQHGGVIYDQDYNGTVTPASGMYHKYDMPIAYDIVYQVTTYARHPRHDRAIIYALLNKFPSKYGKLAVPNQLGTETGYRSMFLDGFTKRDTVESETGNRRLLRNVYSVRVVSEMSPSVADTAIKAATTVSINYKTKTPSGYYTVL